MRITGGVLRGRRIDVPSGTVRPTQDRVREALFSSLAPYIAETRVLDLYAGSGALGLEAWSRGAVHVCWVEADRSVFRVLKKNVDSLCGAGGSDTLCVCLDVMRFLKQPGSWAGMPYDFILADPPYDRHTPHIGLEHIMVALEAAPSLLAPDGWLVFEQHDTGEALERQGWALRKDKRYGETRLRYYQRLQAKQENEL